MKNTTTYQRAAGFSLIELAVVLFIISILMGGLLPTISSQIEQKSRTDTIKQLDEIQQALIGFAIVNGRLPCPASSTTYGMENPLGGSTSMSPCINAYDGFVPAATLGLPTEIDNQGNKGFAVDAWGNRIRYAVTKWNSNTFTTPIGMKTYFATPLAPDLIVCSSASTNTNNCSVANSTLTSSPGVPAIIYSTGKNGAYGGTGTDEAENLTKIDKVFVSHTPTPSPNEFDDLVIWISPNILINRMVSASVLP